MYDIEKIKKKLIKKIDENRYNHTLGVMYTAAALAMKYDPAIMEKALVAGLLHDNAKCMEEDKILEKSIKHGIEVSDFDRANPFILHGPLGAYYAKAKYDIEDEDILGAIRWHTTGRPDMTLLEKIVFVADYIEPGRTKQNHLSELRTLAFEDIDKCVYQISDDTLNFLSGRKRLINDMTVKTKDFYEKYR